MRSKIQYTDRNTAVEVLRIFFMCCIVMSHGLAYGSNMNYELIYAWGQDVSTFFHLSMFSLGKIGVTGFIFISGYYGIRLRYKSLLTLVAICMFYSMGLMGGGLVCFCLTLSGGLSSLTSSCVCLHHLSILG